MKRIIITETDEGVVTVEHFYKDPHVGEDWKLLEDEIDHHGGVVGFTRLFNHGMREIKMKHMKATRKKI